jgi:hypothetical protein
MEKSRYQKAINFKIFKPFKEPRVFTIKKCKEPFGFVEGSLIFYNHDGII